MDNGGGKGKRAQHPEEEGEGGLWEWAMQRPEEGVQGTGGRWSGTILDMCSTCTMKKEGVGG